MRPLLLYSGWVWPNLKPAPLRVAPRGPAPGIARQREDLRPTDGLLAPAERLGHGLPDGDDHRPRAAGCPCGRGGRGRFHAPAGVAEVDVDGGSGAGEVRVAGAGDDLVQAFTRAHRRGGDADGASVREAVVFRVEGGGGFLDPLFLLGAVGEGQIERALGLCVRGCRGIVGGFRRRGGRFAATGHEQSDREDGQTTGERANGHGCEL